MKDSEIKARVASFLRRTAKTVVLPATLGLGLGLAGCGDERTVQQPGDDASASAPAQVDGGSVGLPAAKYAAAFPSADAGVPDPAMDYAAPFPEVDAGVPEPAMDYAAPFPEVDAGVPDPNMDYAAPFPEVDAGTDATA